MSNPDPGKDRHDPGAARRQPPSGRWSTPELGVVAVTVALALLLTFPVFAVANSATPIILGMPLSMFWIVAWIVAEFLLLLGIYGWEHRRGRR